MSRPLSALGPSRSAIALFAFAALLALLYGTYCVHASFYTDDWTDHRYMSIIRDLAPFLQTINPRRPVMWLYLYAQFRLLGNNATYYAMLSITLAFAEAALVFTILRRLRIAYWVAFGVAAALCLSPIADATRLWATGSTVTFAILLWLAGLHAGLSFLSDEGRSRWAWLAASSVCYFLSALTYEGMFPCVLLTVFAYALYVRDFRRAVTPYVFAIAPLLVAGILFTRHIGADVAGYQISSFHDIAVRALLFVSQIPGVFNEVFGAVPTSALGYVLTACSIAPALLIVTKRSASNSFIFQSASIIIAGYAIVLTGWLGFLFAPAYMVPLSRGWDNRVNAIASIGFCLILAGLFVLLWGSITVQRFQGNVARFCKLATIALIVFSMSIAAKANIASQQPWLTAADTSRSIISDARAHVFPLIECGKRDTIFARDITTASAPGVYIFENQDVLTSMFNLFASCPTAQAAQIDAYSTLSCEREGVAAVSGGKVILRSRYRNSIGYIYGKKNSGVAWAIDDRRSCVRLELAFPTG